MKSKFKIGDKVRLKVGARRRDIDSEIASYPSSFVGTILTIKEIDSGHTPGLIVYYFENFYSCIFEEHLEKVCRLNRRGN